MEKDDQIKCDRDRSPIGSTSARDWAEPKPGDDHGDKSQKALSKSDPEDRVGKQHGKGSQKQWISGSPKGFRRKYGRSSLRKYVIRREVASQGQVAARIG